MVQKFKFPMEYMRVTQREESVYSHAGSLAMDFGGKDSGADKLYCPCDMVVKRCRQNANGELYLESTLPVQFADGTTDYARLLCLHDGSFNVVEGQVLKQGDYFYDEGGMGSGNPNAFAVHVHMEAGKGKWASCTQSRNSQGTFVIERQGHLYDLFVLGDDVIIKDDGGFAWKRVSDLEKPESNDFVYGVDVSHNRSADIVSKIKAAGKADFVIMRVAVGSASEDKHLAQYIKDSEGMKKGFFSINYFNSVEDAVEEADFLIDTIQKYGFTPDKVDLPIFCDWEGLSYEWNKNQGVEITAGMLQRMTEAYCNRIIERGYKAGIYMSLNFWDNWYGRRFIADHPEYYIWYARPGYAQPDRDCYLWQYACDNGSEYGADEPLDKNILLGEYIEAKPPCEECERLKEQIVELEKTNAELEQAVEGARHYEEENKQLKADLQVAAPYMEKAVKLEMAIVEKDKIIETMEKEFEFVSSKADKYMEATAGLEKEKGVLKETIASLQEKVEAVTKENEQLKRAVEDARPYEGDGGADGTGNPSSTEPEHKEGLLTKILKILFGGA